MASCGRGGRREGLGQDRGRPPFRPAPVRELLVDLKDLSELAIDLAYSSYLFHSPDLAREVLELEEHVEDLLLSLEVSLMLAARSPDRALALAPISRVASSMARVVDAAADIAKTVAQGAGLHPAIGEAFSHARERLVRTVVEEGSSLVGSRVGELDPWVEVIAIKRDGSWLLNPEDDEVLRPGDVLIARGSPEEASELVELAEGRAREPLSFGPEGKMARLADLLLDLKESSELAIDLAYTALLLNSEELAEEVKRLEEYVDELHVDLQTAVISGKLSPADIGDVIALLRVGFLSEEIADAAYEIASFILKGLRAHPVVKMAIEESDERVAVVQVAEDSPLVGKKLSEVRLPEETGMWVVAMRREGRFFRPRGSTVIRPGDVLIAVGYAEGEEDLAELAEGKSGS
ncbi:potassium channel protein [Candidatus Bathyarchaeota archaeon]|nr:MAG: potassium channel protein [Candidatus Bathyarchaeota archaeon]